MRVTICGHAGLYVETSDQRILLDPCFSDTLLDGALTYHPGRLFEPEKMPTPTALVVTHGHFDHFHPESLQRLPRGCPVVTSTDARVLRQLKSAGFVNVTACGGWQSIELGDTRVLTTPSEHDEPEFGLIFQEKSGATFWHMADAEVSIEIGERIIREYNCIDLVSAKYQPVVGASIGYLRGAGARFDKREVATWLESACVCNPKLIFPYASGLCFCGRHAWFNRYAFPLSQEEVVRMLQRRLGSHERATTVEPGDVIDVDGRQQPVRHAQASPFVHRTTSSELQWEPIDTVTLNGLSSNDERRVLQRELEEFMSGRLASWLAQNVWRHGSMCSVYRSQEVVWQLVVHAGGGERLNYFIDFRSGRFVALPGEHSDANFFTHIAGRGLADVLHGKMPGLIFWLAGDVRSYEKIMGVRDGHFCFPELPHAPADMMSDPLTCYLRHFGTRWVSANEPELPDFHVGVSQTDLSSREDVNVLTREGESPKVLNKKVLLAYLAAQEAQRIGLEVSDDEIEAASDHFRRELGLYDRQATIRWLDNAGLSLEAYSAVIRDFAIVLKLEKHYANVIAPLLSAHRCVARSRSVTSLRAAR